MRRDLLMRVFIFTFCMTVLMVCVQCQKRSHTGAAARADTTFTAEPASVEEPARAFEPAEGTIDLYARLTYGQRKGKLVFEKYCAVCHGSEGKGDGFNAYNLDPRPRDLTDSTYMAALADARLAETIREGGRRFNKSILMPAWGNTLTADQIDDIIAYVRSLAK